jgi:L-aspartate oxidase
MSEQHGSPVLLDATGLGVDRLAHRFPGLDAACRAAGYDWSAEPVPITPAAHYAMGGVVTDLDGRTTLPGLFAVGETARAGVHGANRLASNSLLEAAVFADRAARALGTPGSARVRGFGDRARHAVAQGGLGGVSAGIPESGDMRRGVVDRGALQQLMWEHVGLERDEEGLGAASAQLAAWTAPAPRDRRSAEDRNLLDLARLTVAAALARRDSVGAHFRADAAAAAQRPAPEREAA